MTRTDHRLPVLASALKAMFPGRDRHMAVSGAMGRSSRLKRVLGTLHLPIIVQPR